MTEGKFSSMLHFSSIDRIISLLTFPWGQIFEELRTVLSECFYKAVVFWNGRIQRVALETFNNSTIPQIFKVFFLTI